jgi:alpha-L-rhamnosidase
MIVLFLVNAFRAQTTSKLRCEGGDAWGSSAAAFPIDNAFPTFTWANEHPTRGAEQSSFEFELRAHSSAADAFTAMPLVWSSGPIASTVSTFTYPSTAPALRSATTYAFSVRYADQNGTLSEWSPVAGRFHFAGALDWDTVAWIGSATTNLYRTSFTLAGASPVTSAIVYSCGLGYAYLRVNGAPAGVDGAKRMILHAPWSNNDKRNGYSAFDITAQLAAHGSENVLAVGLGNGWRTFARKDPEWSGDKTDRVLRLQLVVTTQDGQITVVSHTGDGKWTTAEGPSVTDSVYNGEAYDAQREQANWDRPSFAPATPWAAATALAPKDAPLGVMSAWAAPPVLLDTTVAAVSVTNPYPTIFVVDFGINQAGVTRLNDLSAWPLEAGDTIVMKHAEILEHEYLPGVNASDYGKMIYQGNLRTAKQTDTYVAKGGDNGSWFPAFTYHGYRYVEVTLPAGLSLAAADVSMLHFHRCVRVRVRVRAASARDGHSPLLPRSSSFSFSSFVASSFFLLTSSPRTPTARCRSRRARTSRRRRSRRSKSSRSARSALT